MNILILVQFDCIPGFQASISIKHIPNYHTYFADSYHLTCGAATMNVKWMKLNKHSECSQYARPATTFCSVACHHNQPEGRHTDVETEGGPVGTLLISRIVYHVNESNICPQSGSYKESLRIEEGEWEGRWKDCRGQRDILINQMCKSHGTNRDSLIGNNYRGEEYEKKNRLCRVNWIVQIFVRFVGHVKTRTRLPLICEMKSWVLNHLSCFSITRCCSASLSFSLTLLLCLF